MFQFLIISQYKSKVQKPQFSAGFIIVKKWFQSLKIMTVIWVSL